MKEKHNVEPEHHVLRHISKNRFGYTDTGEIVLSIQAFELRVHLNEPALSVSWLEYFKLPKDDALKRAANATKRDIKKEVLAVANVKKIIDAGSRYNCAGISLRLCRRTQKVLTIP